MMGERDHRRKRKLCILVSLMEILCCFLIKMPHIFIWQRVPQIVKSHLPPWPGGSVPLLQLQILNTFVILIPVNPQPFFFQTFFFKYCFSFMYNCLTHKGLHSFSRAVIKNATDWMNRPTEIYFITVFETGRLTSRCQSFGFLRGLSPWPEGSQSPPTRPFLCKRTPEVRANFRSLEDSSQTGSELILTVSF